jgi:hypothetical protein
MSGRCGCGVAVEHAFHHFGCLECGAGCCTACAVPLESATYCRRCAGALLGTAAVRAGGRCDLY